VTPPMLVTDGANTSRSRTAARSLRTTCAAVPDSPSGTSGASADAAQVVLRGLCQRRGRPAASRPPAEEGHHV
jgi:hypothetical protein